MVCERLRRDDLQDLLGETIFEPALDLRPYVPQIERTAGEVRAAVVEHQKSQRRIDELLSDKNEAIEEYDVAFVRVLYCHERTELYRHPIRRVLTWCANNLRLEKSFREALSEAIADFEEEPYRADTILCELRRSFVVPVPCLVGHL